MVNSEKLFEYIRKSSMVQPSSKNALQGESLAEALEAVVRLVECETHASLTRDQMKLMIKQTHGQGFGPPPGSVVPVAS